MSISIIGTGTVGSTLARVFSAAGIPAQLASSRGRSAVTLDSSAGGLITPVELTEALAADVVIPAVPFSAMQELGRSVPDWGGRIVVDLTNPFGVDPAIFGGRTSAEYNADFFVGARFVKALNHLAYGLYETPIEGQGGRRAIFVAGDDPAANAEVGALLTSLGLAPLDFGALAIGAPLFSLGGPLLTKNLVEYPG